MNLRLSYAGSRRYVAVACCILSAQHLASAQFLGIFATRT